MSGKYIDWDEMIGYIMRKTNEKEISLFYSDVKAVLDAEKKYMAEKNIVYKIEDK